MMKRTAMYEECPVCHGHKKVKQRVKYSYGYKEVETSCWACRGSGYVNYNEEEVITSTRIEEMYDSLGV